MTQDYHILTWDEFIFHQIFKKHGGIDKHKNYLTKGNSGHIFKGFETLDKWKRKKYPNIPEIHVNSINNSSFGAHADIYKSKGYIGIRFGSFYILQDLFYRMLSCPEVLKEFGNPSIEIKPEPLFNAQNSDFMTVFTPNSYIIPKNGERQDIANLLTEFAMKFLYLHEYFHIVNGHCDYKVTRKDNPFKALDLQTLEMDADCSAVCFSIQEVFAYNENYKSFNSKFIQTLFKDVDKLVYLWMYALYSLFRIQGYRESHKKKLLTDNYPPVGSRQKFVFSTLYTFLEKELNPLKDKVSKLSNKTILNVEKAFEEISEQGYDTKQIRFAMDIEVHNHELKILENWNNIRPELSKYAYVKLAPLHS